MSEYCFYVACLRIVAIWREMEAASCMDCMPYSALIAWRNSHNAMIQNLTSVENWIRTSKVDPCVKIFRMAVDPWHRYSNEAERDN